MGFLSRHCDSLSDLSLPFLPYIKLDGGCVPLCSHVPVRLDEVVFTGSESSFIRVSCESGEFSDSKVVVCSTACDGLALGSCKGSFTLHHPGLLTEAHVHCFGYLCLSLSERSAEGSKSAL